MLALLTDGPLQFFNLHVLLAYVGSIIGRVLYYGYLDSEKINLGLTYPNAPSELTTVVLIPIVIFNCILLPLYLWRQRTSGCVQITLGSAA